MSALKASSLLLEEVAEETEEDEEAEEEEEILVDSTIHAGRACSLPLLLHAMISEVAHFLSLLMTTR